MYRRRGFGWTRSIERAWEPVDALGRQFHFVWMALRGVGHALAKHRRQTTEIFTGLAWGNGRAVIVGGGVAPVLALMGVVSGAMIGNHRLRGSRHARCRSARRGHVGAGQPP
nr:MULTISPECIES: hypothetical protein [Gordonia]